jgi:hypothetical protein
MATWVSCGFGLRRCFRYQAFQARRLALLVCSCLRMSTTPTLAYLGLQAIAEDGSTLTRQRLVMSRFSLVVAWIALFFTRILLGRDGGPLDEALLWTLRLLTLVIAIWLASSPVRFAKDTIKSARCGDQVFTERTIKVLLVSGLMVGLGCRLWSLSSGDEGVMGWTGAILICVSLLGLAVLYLTQARNSSRNARLTFWHPYFRIGFLITWGASLIALGATKPSGVTAGVLVSIFWLCLIALIVHLLGSTLRTRKSSLSR